LHDGKGDRVSNLIQGGILMFRKKSKIAITIVVTFLMLFATMMPASAATVECLNKKCVDKSELASAIEAASELNEADYTEESWSNLIEALTAAETVMEDKKATQEMVDEVAAGLNEAIEALEEKVEDEVDKSELASVIESVYELNEADYTEESWNNLMEALTAAETVMEDEEATQEMVDEAVAGLNEAIEALEEKVEDDDKDVQIEIYKKLLEAFEKMQDTYDRLLDIFDSIFAN
jgi:predicted secreted protein